MTQEPTVGLNQGSIIVLDKVIHCYVIIQFVTKWDGTKNLLKG